MNAQQQIEFIKSLPLTHAQFMTWFKCTKEMDTVEPMTDEEDMLMGTIRDLEDGLTEEQLATMLEISGQQ